MAQWTLEAVLPACGLVRPAGLALLGVLAVGQTARGQDAPDPPGPDLAAATAADQDPAPSRWIDPEDGWFDVTDFLEHPAGFLPLVVPITEPAVGYGAVLAAAFLDPREEAGAAGWARPNITVVGGMLTEDGSDGLFAANSSIWSGGDLQTLVGVGSFNLDLSLYGIGADPTLDHRPLGYSLEADGAIAEVRRRIAKSDFWAGLRFAYARVDVEFDRPPAGVEDLGPEDVTLAGPALTLRYDSLDNMFTPTRGTLSDTSVSVFDEAFGGSDDFQLVQQILIRQWPLADDLFLGARGQYNASFGDVPFYARPYVHLRGVPALRYQGEQAFSVEGELRWQFKPRIGLVGFGGWGQSWTGGEDFDRTQDAWGGGGGVRYLVSRKFGLHVGLDVARGPEDGVIYVQLGNAWIRP